MPCFDGPTSSRKDEELSDALNQSNHGEVGSTYYLEVFG